jgi:hypothetical protein
VSRFWSLGVEDTQGHHNCGIGWHTIYYVARFASDLVVLLSGKGPAASKKISSLLDQNSWWKQTLKDRSKRKKKWVGVEFIVVVVVVVRTYIIVLHLGLKMPTLGWA